MRRITVACLAVGLGSTSGLLSACGSQKAHTATALARTGARPPSFTRLIAFDDTGVIRIEARTCEGTDIGTGFLITPRLVATVDHVVDQATLIDLKHESQTVAIGKVIGEDEARDVALVEASKPISGHLFTLATRSPELGENVAAIGFPLGLPLTVTKGSVSGLDRTVPINGTQRRRLVQTDAAVNPGNSGGPLISQEDGEVIGLVDLGTSQANGTAFAVSAEVAVPLIAAWRLAPQATSTASCSSGPPEGTAPAPPSQQEAITNTLEQHFTEIKDREYHQAWQDFTQAEGERLKGEQTWIEGQEQGAMQAFTLSV